MRRRERVIPLVIVAAVLATAGGLTWVNRGGGDAPATRSTPTISASKPAPERPWGPTDDEMRAAQAKADGLTLEQLAGQLIIARHFSNDQSLALVRDLHFAGVMVTGEQILDIEADDPLTDVKAFNQQLHDAGQQRGVPVMVPIDQEGGLVARLREPLTTFGTFMSAGAAIKGHGDAGRDAVTRAAQASGAELRDAGYNTVFAPVGDVTIGPADPIIGSRSAGSDPQVVADAVVAAVKGYGQAGMISSVKHFPGHNVDTDSHKSLPALTSDAQRLRTHDLVPFKAAVDAGAPSIMTGHLNVTAINKGVPASVSRKVITTGLRENLGFDGLVISDSLGMGAIMNRYPGGQAAVEAIKAGSDLALMPADNQQAYDAMLDALKSGDLPEQQARASAARTIAYLNHSEASAMQPGAPGSGADAAQQLSALAATIVAHPCPVPKIEAVIPAGPPEVVDAFRIAALEAGLPVGSGTRVAFLGPGISAAAADVVVSTDTPYGLASSAAPTKIALYGRGVPAMRALVDVLMRKQRALGQSPVETGVEPSPSC